MILRKATKPPQNGEGVRNDHHAAYASYLDKSGLEGLGVGEVIGYACLTQRLAKRAIIIISNHSHPD